MDTETIEALLSLNYDAPCKHLYTKNNSMYFIIESRSSKALSKVENEIICDNFIETDLDGQIKVCNDFALKTDKYIIVDVNKNVHGRDVRDKLVVYNSEMDVVKEFINDENNQFCLRLLNDKLRCIKDSKDTYYNLDGSIIKIGDTQ